MHNKILIVFFICLLALSSGLKIFENSEEVNTEKRVRAPFPSFEIESMIDFPESFTKYVNDNFGGRSFFIALNSLVKSKIFRTTRKSASYGTNGWLYLSSDKILSIYNNPIPYTKEDLKRIARIQIERMEWLKLQGMDYYLFIPPATHTIYPEYLPGTFKKCYPLTKREQVIQYLQENTEIKVIVVDDVLLRNKKNHLLYYKTDTHWNYHAGFYVYQYLVDYFKEIYPDVPSKFGKDDFNIAIEKDQSGDLLDLLHLAKPENSLDTVYALKEPCCKATMDSNRGPEKLKGYLVRSQNTCDSTLPNIFIYRDSYSTYVVQHLIRHFNKSVLLWGHAFQPAITKKEGCEIVLFEVAEHMSLILDSENPTEMKEELKRNGIAIKL